jgi:glycosyltransferase involved in cell wall biosynthesis
MKSISFDVVIIHNSRALTAWFLMYRWFFKHVKVVCEIHSFRENGYLTKEINGFLYRQCDHVVVLSHAAKEYLEQQYGADKVTIVYNGVDIRNLVREREYSADSGVTFAYVGSFHEWQGVFILAEALNSLGRSFLKSNKVYLVGGGPAYKDCLNKLTAELRNHPNLICKGWSSRDEVNDILNVTDYLLAPRPSTLATETVVPLKVFESIEYKIPLIATPVGGLKEVFLPEGDGAIFTEDCSAASLAKMMSAPKSYMDYQQLLDNLDVLSARVPSWKAVSQIYSDLANSI